jgi:hypothetical protein
MGHHVEHTEQNSKFVFDGKTKAFTLALTALGAICLLIMGLTDSELHYTRFWSTLLLNAVFFTGIAFASLFFICTHTMAWGGWHVAFKRIPEAMMMYMPVGAVFLLALGLAVMFDAPGTEFLYMWADESLVKTDKLIAHKSAMLNPMVYLLTIAVIALWAVFANIIRKISIRQDGENNPATATQSLFRTRFWSAIFLPIAGFSSAFVIWMWVMSVDAHWYSTMFAWYATVSLWVSAVSIMLLIAVFLKSRGLLPAFTKEHMHDLGKYIFGFSIFWTYLWFSQFMLIWYANNGEETQYFFLRFEEFKPIFFLNLLINFVLPFFLLLMNSAKRTLGVVGFTAGLVCFGHWLDFYQMIKPGTWHNLEHSKHSKHEGTDHKDHGHTYNYNGSDNNSKFDGGQAQLTHYNEPDTTAKDSSHAHGDTLHTHTDTTNHAGHDHTNHDGHDHGDHAAGDHATGDEHAAGDHAAHEKQFIMGVHFPSLLDVGTMLGFMGLFLFVTFSYLSKASLYPKNDPFMGESENHHI